MGEGGLDQLALFYFYFLGLNSQERLNEKQILLSFFRGKTRNKFLIR